MKASHPDCTSYVSNDSDNHGCMSGTGHVRLDWVGARWSISRRASMGVFCIKGMV
jgi:hypothetical protein